MRRILVEEMIEIDREFYLSITLDRAASRYCLIASAEGGVNIEETAVKHPEKVLKLTIDPFTGLRSYQARRIALGLDLHGSVCEDCTQLILSRITSYNVCYTKLLRRSPAPPVESDKGKTRCSETRAWNRPE